MNGPKPLTKQRSAWTRGDDFKILGVPNQRWERKVTDGPLTVLVAEEPLGWHLSISHRGHPRKKGAPHLRYPHWDEISHARYELLPDDITVAMLLPPAGEYVAVHDTTFHLHEIEAPR